MTGHCDTCEHGYDVPGSDKFECSKFDEDSMGVAFEIEWRILNLEVLHWRLRYCPNDVLSRPRANCPGHGPLR